MLIGHERLFYRGLLGANPNPRTLGAVTLYASQTGRIRLWKPGEAERQCRVAAVAAFVPHFIETADDRILTLCIEPETVMQGEIDRLISACDRNDGGELFTCMEHASAGLGGIEMACGFTVDAFDRMFFGRTLERRRLDARIADIVRRLSDESCQCSAEELAKLAGLSVSRLLHLFKQETSVPFRSFRAWKRARRFLNHANHSDKLTDIALGLGYPDSSHFSRSIRRTFGLKPRSIRQGSRALKIVAGAGYSLAAG